MLKIRKKQKQIDKESKEKLKRLHKSIDNAMSRAEEVKKQIKLSSNQARSESTQQLSLEDLNLNDSEYAKSIEKRGGPAFTKDEINVLRYGSKINGRSYVPFLGEIDKKEKFSFPIPYT
jgi:hypothetical protein